MIVIASEGRLPAPVEEVWAVVRSAEGLPAWLAGLRRVRAEGPEGFGRRLWLTGSRAVNGPDQPVEIIAWKPPTLMAWRHVDQGRRADRRGARRPDELHVQLTPAGEGGTHVLVYAVSPARALEGPLLRLGPARRWRGDLARSLARLADLVRPPAR